jgi:hypothetical protein
MGGFGGPAAIGPGMQAAGMREIGFQPWVSARGMYMRNLDSATIVPERSRDIAMGGVLGGAAMSKLWRRTSFTGAYMGSAFYIGTVHPTRPLMTSHVGAFNVTHQVAKRVQLQASQLVGSAVGGFGFGAGAGNFGVFGMGPMANIFAFNLLGGGGAGDPALTGVVDADLFLSRTNFFASNGGVAISATNRMTLTLGGGTFLVRRAMAGLNDLNSFNVSAGGNYRVSRRFSVMSDYRYVRFDFVGRFGTTNLQSAMGGFQFQLAPRTFVAAFGGLQDIDRTHVGMVLIDPEIAALLGTPVGFEILQRRFRALMGGGQLVHAFRRGGATVAAWRGVTPGNDVLQTAIRDQIMANYSRPVTENNSVGFMAIYINQTGLVQTGVRIRLWQGGITYARRILPTLHFNVMAGYRGVDSVLAGRSLRQPLATIGLDWRPTGIDIF